MALKLRVKYSGLPSGHLRKYQGVEFSISSLFDYVCGLLCYLTHRLQQALSQQSFTQLSPIHNTNISIPNTSSFFIVCFHFFRPSEALTQNTVLVSPIANH